MKQATQTDVAQAAGVSRATVSYVLNERYNSAMPISTKTKEKVLKAVADLGYNPDARARSLRSGKTQTLGLIIPNLHNPHHWEIVEGVMQKAHKLGYEILFSSSDLESKKEENSIKALFRRSVDGIILLPSFIKLYPKLLQQISELQLPVVTIGCRDIGIDCIGSIDTEATNNAIKHLENLGHKKIGFLVTGENQTSGEDRLYPYFQSLTKNKRALISKQIVRVKSTIEDAYRKSLELLKKDNRPTAIITVNDYFAVGVLRAASDLNINIPEDLSIISFDDILLANFTSPRLTTVRLEAKAVGQGAVTILLNRLNNKNLAIQKERIPAKLIIRESTAQVKL